MSGPPTGGPPMSEPANRPVKPDGTYYKPGERLAIAAAAMKETKPAKKERPPAVNSPVREWDLESEIDRALRLMREMS